MEVKHELVKGLLADQPLGLLLLVLLMEELVTIATTTTTSYSDDYIMHFVG